MSDSADPWKGLVLPEQSSTVSGRRVDPELKWNLYWALDTDGGCLLIMQHSHLTSPSGKLPKLRGLEVERRMPAGDHGLLVVRLKDSGQREIFHRLCLDIVRATRLAHSEEDAIERFLARTWRWHRLLRGGRDERLSDDEQKGLLGELQLMRRHLFQCIGFEASIRSWTGPIGSPKDFEIGRVCIEVKARRGAATPFVTISTEHQLDTTGIDALFLHVAEVTITAEDDPKGVTVAEVAESVLRDLQKMTPSVVELFEERLLAVGFSWEDDYSDKKWLIGPERVFEVSQGFPRITPDMYPAGVSNVKYAISLHDCDPFRTDYAHLTSRLSGA